MSFESYKILFFLIHLTSIIALVLHIGIKEDGFDVKTKRLSKQGKIATGIEAMTIIAFAIFVYVYDDLCNLSSLYLGFGITLATFSVPFLSTCHIKHSKARIKLNFAGFVAILVGFSGFLTSFVWFFDRNTGSTVSTDMIDNYISILGQFIAGTSALIAFSGTTIETKQEKNDKGKPIPVTRLTDLGKVAITVIVIGFAVAIIDFNLDNAEKKRVNSEVDEILHQAQSISKNLDGANEFLTDSLLPRTEQWLMVLSDKVDEIEDLDQKLIAVQNDLTSVAKAKKVETLRARLAEYNTSIIALKRQLNGVAKASSINQLDKKMASLEAKSEAIRKQLSNVAKTEAVNQISQQMREITALKSVIKSYQTEIQQLKQQLKLVASKQDVEALKLEIQKLQMQQDSLRK
ncbi:MAG: hypothetical protein ACPGJS_23840 [Flammeovirgaceae bacterium]